MANAFANSYGNRRREPVHVLSPELEPGDPVTSFQLMRARSGNVASAEDEVLRQFANSEFRRALDELPECLKATFFLVDLEGYSNDDVADMIGVPVGTVASRLHRARNRLRKHLSPDHPPSGN
jgi:RNA polymerase sigma-70 factor (ECF subfamily)